MKPYRTLYMICSPGLSKFGQQIWNWVWEIDTTTNEAIIEVDSFGQQNIRLFAKVKEGDYEIIEWKLPKFLEIRCEKDDPFPVVYRSRSHSWPKIGLTYEEKKLMLQATAPRSNITFFITRNYIYTWELGKNEPWVCPIEEFTEEKLEELEEEFMELKRK